MKTHYDTLGVRPGDLQGDIIKAYRELMEPALVDACHVSSMRRGPGANRILEITAAIVVVGHDNRRIPYDKQLRLLLYFCPLCEGKGWVPMGEKDIMGEYKQRMDCAACGTTGRSYS